MSHPFFRRVGRWCGSLLLVAALSACVGGDNQDSAAAQHKVLASVRQSDGTVVAASGFNVGDYVVLQAPAGGDVGANYQWYRNGEPIEGATGASYELGQASSLDDSAEFTVRVSSTANPAGSLSQPLVLSVKAGDGIDLLAGYIGGSGNLDGLGVHARFSTPRSLRHDAAGNLYVRDVDQIRKISPDGQVTTVVSASQLQAAEPYSWLKSMTIDSSGNVYVVSNSGISKFPFAGGAPTLMARFGERRPVDGDAATARLFLLNNGIASDVAGNLYVSDSCSIRVIASTGKITTLAGVAGECSMRDGAGGAARLGGADIQAIDSVGAVYVIDHEFPASVLLRKIDADGNVSTLNQQMQQVSAVLGMPQAEWEPRGLALDKAGNLHLLAHVKQIGSLVILKISPSGAVEKLAGGGQYGDASFIVEGYGFDGDGRISVDPSGSTYVALDDIGTGNHSPYSNHSIYRVAANGRLAPFAGGSADYSSARDGSGRDARFFVPQAIASDSRGNSYIADDNHTIRRIDANGNTSTLAGKAYEAGFADGTGGEARFSRPRGLALDAAGNLYVADSGNHLIRKISPNGVVSTLAGKAGESGGSDGAAAAARFSQPEGLAIDASGNLYVAEVTAWDVHRIRIITPAGQISTRALDAFAYEPASLASDASGNLFAAFSSGIVRLEASGKISLLAGHYSEQGSVDGNGSAARFANPHGITLDPAGNLYVADGATIRKVTQAGVVSTVAGQPGVNGVKLGALPGGLHYAASVAYGMRHSRPALLVVNRGSQPETLSVAFGSADTGPLYAGMTYRQSDVNVVSLPLP